MPSTTMSSFTNDNNMHLQQNDETVKAVISTDDETTTTSTTACPSASHSNCNSAAVPAAGTTTAMIISQAEAMNPARRTTMEDVCVIRPPGAWGCSDDAVLYIGVYDGHGGACVRGKEAFVRVWLLRTMIDGTKKREHDARVCRDCWKEELILICRSRIALIICFRSRNGGLFGAWNALPYRPRACWLR
jgi:hypothetical protein